MATAIRTSPLASVLFGVPDGRVIGASRPAATLLLGDEHAAASDLLGRSVADLGVVPASSQDALRLLARGEIQEYRQTGVLVPQPARPALAVSISVTAGSTMAPVTQAVAVLSPVRQPDRTSWLPPARCRRGEEYFVGVVDGDWRVTQISPSPSGARVQVRMGQSVLSLVHPDDAPKILVSLGLAASTKQVQARELRWQLSEDEGWDIRRTLISPLAGSPLPAFMFVNLPLPAEPANPLEPTAGQGPNPQSSLAQLSPRQREIVSLLLAGERVPAIARSLYLSQSTVRNHLSAAFRALGVHSQQALVHLLKKPAAP